MNDITESKSFLLGQFMIDWFYYRSKSELRHSHADYIIPVYDSIYFLMVMHLYRYAAQRTT